MPRTIVDIREDQLREVDRICTALKISRAEAVRRGVDEFIRSHASIKEDGFGLWRGTKEATADPVETVRRRW